MSVALILVNYNGQTYLPDLFDSLSKLDYPSNQADIFFVDNASDDRSIEWVKKNIDRAGRSIFVIENRENCGFAAGNNIGIRTAFKSNNYKFIVLLNVDTVVDAEWLAELVKKAESDSQIGAAQSLILLHNQPHLINTDGNQLHFLGFGWSGNYELRITNYELRNLEIGYASGAAVLYQADVLRQIGLLDEQFFMYHEDLELSWRMRLAGYKICLAPKSIIYHKYQFSRYKKKWHWIERNRLLVYFTMYKLRTLILFMPVFILTEVGILVYSLIGGWFWYKLRSHLEVLWSIGYIIKKRRQIGQIRKRGHVSDRQVLTSMTAQLNFPEIKSPLIKFINPILEGYFKMIKRIV